MNHSYSVYMHLFPNGKRYIGITANSLKRRWARGIGYKGQPRVYRAIKKYGWENIKHIVLFEGLTKEEACKKERDLIKKYKTTDIKYGYNISLGGEDGNKGAKRTEKQKKYIKKRCTQESGKMIIHFFLDDNDVIIGQEIFDSINEASRKTKVRQGTISRYCKFHWCQHYFEYGACGQPWAYYDEFYKEELLASHQCVDAALYRFLISKGIYDEWFLQNMGADLNFWKKLTKYDKKVRKSSESQVKKVLI